MPFREEFFKGFLLFFFVGRIIFALFSFDIPTLIAAETACSWSKTSSGGWHDSAANWSCGAIPNNETYNVTICNGSAGGAITITATTSVTVGKLTIGAPGGTSSSCNSQTHTVKLSDSATLIVKDDDGWSGGGDLVLASRGTLQAANGNTIIVEGDWEASDDSGSGTKVFTFGTSTVKLTGTGYLDIRGQTKGFYNLEIATSSQTTTIKDGFTSTLANTEVAQVTNLTVGNGTVSDGTSHDDAGIEISNTLTAPSTTLNDILVKYLLSSPRSIYPGVFGGIGIYMNNDEFATTLSGSTTAREFLIIENPSDYNSPLNTGGHNLTVNGLLRFGFNAGAFPGDNFLNITGNTTLEVAGDIRSTTDANTGELEVKNGNTIRLLGDMVLYNADDFISGSSTIHIVGTSTDQLWFYPGSIYNLVLNHAGSSGSDALVATTSDFIIGNDLALTNGTFDISRGSKNVRVGGDVAISSGGDPFFKTGRTNRFIIEGENSSYTDSLGNFTLGNVFISSSTASSVLTLNSSATATAVHIGSGETLCFGSSNYMLTLTDGTGSSTPFVVVGTFNPNGGTVKYTGTTTNQTIASTTYASLIIDDANGSNGGVNRFTVPGGVITNALTIDEGNLIVTGDISIQGTFSNLGGYLKETEGVVRNSSSLSINASSYTVGDSITITLTDKDENISATSTDRVSLSISLGNDSETVSLPETSIASGVFRGTININDSAVTSGDGKLNAGTGVATINISYQDGEDPEDENSTSATLNILSGGPAGSFGIISPSVPEIQEPQPEEDTDPTEEEIKEKEKTEKEKEGNSQKTEERGKFQYSPKEIRIFNEINVLLSDLTVLLLQLLERLKALAN